MAPDGAGTFADPPPDPDPDPPDFPPPAAAAGALGVAAGVVEPESLDPDPLDSPELPELLDDPESLLEEDVDPALILPCWELRESFR